MIAINNQLIDQVTADNDKLVNILISCWVFFLGEFSVLYVDCIMICNESASFATKHANCIKCVSLKYRICVAKSIERIKDNNFQFASNEIKLTEVTLLYT